MSSVLYLTNNIAGRAPGEHSPVSGTHFCVSLPSAVALLPPLSPPSLPVALPPPPLLAHSSSPATRPLSPLPQARELYPRESGPSVDRHRLRYVKDGPTSLDMYLLSIEPPEPQGREQVCGQPLPWSYRLPCGSQLLRASSPPSLPPALAPCPMPSLHPGVAAPWQAPSLRACVAAVMVTQETVCTSFEVLSSKSSANTSPPPPPRSIRMAVHRRRRRGASPLPAPPPPKTMPDCGVHYLWFAFVCFLIRSHPPQKRK